tara:strand:+ start:4891 stop:6507 length:1617 start_codon:yes stop_codon:yes gene_type:complete
MKLEDHLRSVSDYLKEVRSAKNSEILAILDDDVEVFNEVLPHLHANSSIFQDGKGFYLGIEWPLPYEWPLALDASFIPSDTEADKVMRAEGILSSLPADWHKAKFLDFGCGEGHVVQKAKSKAAFAIGYDVKATVGNCTTNWKDVLENGPYDFILMFDVLDHLTVSPAKVLSKLKGVLAPGGTLWVRCHPWTSRHGGHLYQTLNKAYAHLVFSEAELNKHDIRPEKTLKLTTPLDDYWQWFASAGFTVEKESITTERPEGYFSKGYIKRGLFALWNSHEFVKDLRVSYPYNCGSDIQEGEACIRRPHPDKVGSYQPNQMGFFDMHGNVWEWCEDIHAPYTVFDNVSFDPCLRSSSFTNNRVIRGGGCWDQVDNCRSACRLHSMMPEARNPDLGFRVVLETGGKDKKHTNDLGMVLLRVDPSVFWMGSPPDEIGRNLELEQRHLVRITKPYYMSAHPVTQQQYEEVIGVNPSEFKDERTPITNINWNDAKKFCEKLSDKTNESYRLPTEAEWELACRGLNFSNSVGAILSVQFVDYILR